MVERCNICWEPADSNIDCNGPRHKLVIKKEVPVEEIQTKKPGA